MDEFGQGLLGARGELRYFGESRLWSHYEIVQKVEMLAYGVVGK